MKFHQTKYNSGSALLLVLLAAAGLAAFVVVAVSLNRQTTQTTASRGESAEAKVVLESTANQILGFLEQQGRTNQGIYTNQLAAWLAALPARTNGHYYVNPATDVGIQYGLNFHFYTLNALPLTANYDPDWANIKMQTTNATLVIRAHHRTTTKDYLGTYNFVVRAVPTTEFAIFSALPLQGTYTVSDRDGTRPKSQVWAPQSAASISGNVSVNTTEAQSNYRRTQGKSENPWSEGLRTLIITPDQTKMSQLSAITSTANGNPRNLPETLNALPTYTDAYTTPLTVSNTTINLNALLQTTHKKGFQAILPNALSTNLIANAPYKVFTYDQPLTYFGAYKTNVVVINLSNLVNNANLQRVFPRLTNAVYLITQAENLGSGNTVQLTFPSDTIAYIQGSINTNRTTKLRIEGNLGMISQALNVFDTNADTSSQRRIVVVDPQLPTQTLNWEVTTVTNVSTLLLPVVNATNFLVTRELNDALYKWASAQQQILLRTEGNPYHLDNPNRFYLPLRTYTINETVTPNYFTETDTFSSRFVTYTSNRVVNYNFAGLFSLNTCSSSDLAGAVLNEIDSDLPAICRSFNLNIEDSTTLTRSINLINSTKSYGNAKIITMVGNTPHPTTTTNYASTASIEYWTPQNATHASTISANLNATDLAALTAYAEAWITVEPDTYYEHFTETRTNYYATADCTYTTPTDTTTNIPSTDIYQGATTWRERVWTLWSHAITNQITPGEHPTFQPTSFADRFSGGLDRQIGGWKHTLTTVAVQNYTTDLDPVTELNATADTATTRKFTTRTVRFHYRPLGWSINPTIPTTNNTPPLVWNGRFVANQNLNTLSADNIGVNTTINGQLTIKNREDLEGTTSAGSTPKMQDIIVSRDATVLPNDPDRIYDIRITSSRIVEQ